MTTLQRAPALDKSDGGYDQRRWTALPIPLAALFMALFDFFVVGLAAPSAQRDLTGGVAGVELILSSFAFPYAAGLLAGGALGDRYGRRRLFTLGVAGFMTATALCAMAPTLPVLLTARLIQGAAAALLVPQAFAMVSIGFPTAERPRAFALLGATLGLASVAGQALGGLVVSADLWGLGWRTVFLVNIPIGLAVLAAAVRLLSADVPARRTAFDLTGLLLAIATMTALLGAVNVVRFAGWPVALILGGLVAPACAVAFAWRSRRVTRLGGEPLVRLPLFTDGRAGIAVTASGLVYAFQAALFLVLSLHLQETLHTSAATTGLVFVALGAAYSASSLLGSRLLRSHGYATRLACVLLTLTGAVAMIACVRAGVTLPAAYAVPLVLVGAGAGLLMTSLTALILNGATPGATSRASGVLASGQQFAVAFSVSITGLLLPDGAEADATEPATIVLVLCAAVLCGVFLLVGTATDQHRRASVRVRTADPLAIADPDASRAGAAC